MDIQTILLWAARLACPLAMGAMVWWFLRETNEGETSGQPPAQRLDALQQRRAALEAEIRALEARTDESAPTVAGQPVEAERQVV